MSSRRRRGPKKKRKLIQKMKRQGPLYRVPFRRRRELKTDYSQRKRLLKSGKIRVVARPSNKQILVQFVMSKIGGDQTYIQIRSSDLKQYGWDIATSNLPASYLTGYLAGKRALKAKIKEAILDIGTHTPYSGTKIFATLKGVVDAGVDIPCNEIMLPSDDRIRGEHIETYAKFLAKEDKQKYDRYFAKYLAASKKPENITDYFEDTKSKIDSME